MKGGEWEPSIDLNKDRVVGRYGIFVLQRTWGNLEYEDEKNPPLSNIRKPTKYVASFLPFCRR